MLETIEKLHPAAQVVAVIAIGAFWCVLVWQMFKTFRSFIKNS
jgi:hypothetical protein